MRRWMNGIGLALGLMLAGANGVAADCAPFLSGGGPEGPGFSGTLINEQEVRVTIGASAKYVWMTLDGSYSVSFSMGFYRMNNGDIWTFDCRTYTVIST